MAESNRQDCMRDLLISVDYSTFFIIQPTVSSFLPGGLFPFLRALN